MSEVTAQTDDSLLPLAFQANVELLALFLAQRRKIVERIERLLNAQRKPVQFLQDRALLSRLFEDAFFASDVVTPDQSRLRGGLEAAHWDSGFKPRRVSGLHNDLVHPAEMMIRGFYFWQRTRWPGRNGRTRYAETLFNLYLIRNLELMSMRLWDAGAPGADDRLAQLQSLLDELWLSSPSDQPLLVRDARSLIPLAQSPTTDELAGYFGVAAHTAESFTQKDRIEVQMASVQMIAGHLRSQLRHYCIKDRVSLDDESVVLRSRRSNALDLALLIQGLVPILAAYERAVDDADAAMRLELACTVCQGISPDPELFLNRLDLLGGYSMIEHLFVQTDPSAQVSYSPMGERHVSLLRQFRTLVERLSGALYEDCRQFRPVDGAYSPYGAIYGTPSNLLEDMALKTLDDNAAPPFSLEDVFSDGGADKLAWVSGWRKLPHIDVEVQKMYDYPQPFAEDVFAGIEQALRECSRDAGDGDTHRTGSLHVWTGGNRPSDPDDADISDLPARFIVSSDKEIVAAARAEACDESRLLRDRQEGYFAVSYQAPGGWIAINKDFLTEILGAGRDVNVVGLPPEAAATLSLMCPGIVTAAQASVPPSMLKA